MPTVTEGMLAGKRQARRLREQLGMTRPEAAAACGIPRSTISNMEDEKKPQWGNRGPEYLRWLRLQKAARENPPPSPDVPADPTAPDVEMVAAPMPDLAAPASPPPAEKTVAERLRKLEREQLRFQRELMARNASFQADVLRAFVACGGDGAPETSPLDWMRRCWLIASERERSEFLAFIINTTLVRTADPANAERPENGRSPWMPGWEIQTRRENTPHQEDRT